MDLSIIIVNWNTGDLLRNCLYSIRKSITDISCEIIVVDNASSDGSAAMLKESFPQVAVIENSTNRGFAAANNQALRIMRGRYALLLNTDTVLTDIAVSELYSFMESHPDSAMACGQLLNEDGTLQNSIAPLPGFHTLLFNMPLLEILLPGRFPSKRYRHDKHVEIESGIGACLMVRRSAMDEVGLLDERYFFFMEETDWARRMRDAGWKIHFVPSARIYHLQGRSIGEGIRSRIAFYLSRYRYFRKWYPYPLYLLSLLVVFCRLMVNWFFTLLGNMLTLFSSRRMRLRWRNYHLLVIWHLKNFREILKIPA